MSTYKQLKRKLLKNPKYRKAYEEEGKKWDIKMMHDVSMSVNEIIKQINPKVGKVLKKGDWWIQGVEVEEIIFKLLKKVRRITQLEKK